MKSKITNIILLASITSFGVVAAAEVDTNSEVYKATYEKAYKEAYDKAAQKRVLKEAAAETPAVIQKSSGAFYLGAAGNYGVLKTEDNSTPVYGAGAEVGYVFAKGETGAHRVKVILNYFSAKEIENHEVDYRTTIDTKEKLSALAVRVGYGYDFAITEKTNFYVGVNGGVTKVSSDASANIFVAGNPPIRATLNGKADDTTYIVGAEIGFNFNLYKNVLLNVGAEASVVGPTTFNYGSGISAEGSAAKLFMGKVGLEYRF